MRKHFLRIFILFIFFICPLVVKADFGDLRYEITDVNISGSKITFKGWAFIHKTNNFNIVTDKNGVKYYGGQKIRMRAINEITGDVLGIHEVAGSDEQNYNFYCELFYKTGSKKCTEDNYKDFAFNNCNTSSSNPYCYYEDLYFSLTFDTSKWNVSSDAKISFQIAASNNFFEEKYKSMNYSGAEDNIYTKWETFNVPIASVSNFDNGIIKIDSSSIPNTVRFIASQGILYSVNSITKKFAEYDYKTTYGNWNTSKGSTVFSLYTKNSNYTNGRSKERSTNRCETFLNTNVEKCVGSYYYAISVSEGYNIKIGDNYRSVVIPGNDNIAIARGSHVKPSGSFKIKITNQKKCDVTKTPLKDVAECNGSGTLSSTCEGLTINTDKGAANVNIVQTGIVSSVLTPDSIYAGGGFKFGIMYYNTIKWSYVGSNPGDELHQLVTKKMNDKIKDYSSFIAGIDLSELKLGGKLMDTTMIKKCYGSTSTDYFDGNGLTVTCVFTFPKSSISYDGKVSYNIGSTIDINNKYYTKLYYSNFDEDLDITVKLNGLNRIKDSAATGDSNTVGTSWTGDWSNVNIEGCSIDVYPLLYDSDGKNKFIYRPIDIENPFPNRHAGINWYDWINSTNPNNEERLEKTYTNEPQYTANINNSAITDIKNYNKTHNYLDWDSINKKTKMSSFITGKDYIVRSGG